MDANREIAAIRNAASLAFKADVGALMAAKFDRRSNRIEALKRVTETETRLGEILADIGSPAAANAAAREAEAASRGVVLEALKLSLRTTASIDVRAAQIETIHGGAAARRADISAIARAPAPRQAVAAAEIIEKAGKALRSLRTLASDPKKYLGLAEKFWNQQVRAMAAATRDASIKSMTLTVSEKILTTIDEKLSLTANRVSAASVGRFIGWVGVGLLVVNVVIRAAADDAHWATTLAKGAIPLAATIGLGLVITSEAVVAGTAAIGTVIAAWTASLGAGAAAAAGGEVVVLGGAAVAGVDTVIAGFSSAGVPPAAAVLIATGAIILLGVAVTALVDFLIGTWFGPGMPASMMVAMQAPMSATMRAQMAAPMFRSMSGG